MDFFDQSYILIRENYRPKYKQRANIFALWYITGLQIGLLLLLGVFLYLFLKEMRTIAVSEDKAWLFFLVFSIIIIVRNWLRYSGRQLKIRRAKNSSANSPSFKIWQLFLLLIGLYSISLLILIVN